MPAESVLAASPVPAIVVTPPREVEQGVGAGAETRRSGPRHLGEVLSTLTVDGGEGGG